MKQIIKGQNRLFFKATLVMLLSFSSTSIVVAGEGVELGNHLSGAFGDATNVIKTEVDRLIVESGIEAAATQAQTTLAELAEGAVPVIDDLSDPYQENAEEAIAKALTKVELSTKILKQITGDGAKKAIDFIASSPLFADADFGISTPTGRIRIHRQGTEVSICRTIIGPLGSVIITGISNEEQLCHFPDDRMSNPTKSLLSFTYMAAGHTHIRTNKILIPNLAEDLTLLPAPITAETYVKTIGGQWVQIRLAGADPAGLELEAKFEVGLKGNVSYVVDVEAEGEAALKLNLKPIYAAEVIRSTAEVMLNKATALGLDMDVANQASNAAAIIMAGLEHLSDIESKYEGGFGHVGIDVKLTGGIGVGVWDTGISAVSANSTFNLTYPLAELIGLGGGVLAELLDTTMAMVEANLKLGTSVLEEDAADFATFIDSSKDASSGFVDGVMQELLDASTAKDFTTELTFKLTALGDADKESIEIYEAGLKLPVGDLSESLQTSPNAFGDAFSAISYLLLSAIDPDAVITDETWDDLETVIVPGIEFTLRVRSPVTPNLFGFKEADLLETIKTIADIRTILIGLVKSSTEESLEDVRLAITDTVITADDVVIGWINNVKIEKSKSLGANGALGAEAVAELGAKIELKGEVKGSLFLLLLDLPIYVAPEDGVLASASIPIEFSLDAGASAGEGVELTVDAGGQLKFNAFELTSKHWDGNLPTSALMKVAGFSVLEFDGVVNPDESLAGTGFLMLPMGGIVSAEFDVDEFGNVSSGSWSGGLDLGPLGYFPYIEGALDNDGLHGTIDVSLLGSEFTANFILNSSGLLLGSYDGSITIGGHLLAAANIFLGTDGQFSGHYEGDLDLGGFAASSNLDFDNDGFTGSSNLNVFGSSLVSDDIVITRSGAVSGTFTGDIVAGLHTLSAVSLYTVNGGLIGTAMMDLPGVAGVEVELRIFDGKVSAFYQGDLLSGLISQSSFEITAAGVVMSANFNTSQFPDISSQVLDLVVSAAPLAQEQLAQAEDDLVAAQLAVENAESDLQGASASLTMALEAAQQKVLDATAEAQAALEALNIVIAQIDELNKAYQERINDAKNLLDDAQAAYNSANNLVKYYNKKIKDLDTWYNNLSAYNKAIKLAYYTTKRAQLVTLRTAAIAKRTAAKVTLDTVQLAYNVLTSELADLLNPLELSRTALQGTYDIASAALATAQAELDDIEAEIIADTTLKPFFDALNLAKDALSLAQELVDRLSGTIAMAEYFASKGAEGAFTVLTANVTADLNTLITSSSMEINARVIYLGQQGQVTLMFEPADPVSSFHQVVSALQTGDMSLSNIDVTPPIVIANQAAEWTANQTLIQLLADDNFGGAGIASITYSGTGAQFISEVTVAGKEVYALIDTEGLTSLSFFATDISGNVSPTTTISVSIDNSGPQISVTPSGVNEGVYEVVINAKDLLGSGINYIAVSASGAEYFTESIEITNEVIIALTKEGITTLTIIAVDVAGNETTIAYEANVPDVNEPISEPVSEPISVTPTPAPSAGSKSGGSLGLLSMLLIMVALSLRGIRIQRSYLFN